MTDHAKLPPSGALRWVPCPGSPIMEAEFPEDLTSPESLEGTAAHDYVTRTVETGEIIEAGSLASNGQTINKEMIECAERIVEDIFLTLVTHGLPVTAVQVEKRVHTGLFINANCWGTPDFYLVVTAFKTIYIWDYKYGQGYVDPFRNWQLIAYLAGILNKLNLSQEEMAQWKFVLKIAQPRNYHYSGHLRTWETNWTEVLPLLAIMRQSAAKVLGGSNECNSGDWCRDCRGRPGCMTFIQAGGNALDVSREAIPHHLPPAAVGLMLRHVKTAIKRLEAMEDALGGVALGLIKSGQNVPYCHAERGSGRDRWTAPSNEVFALGDAMGVNLRKEPEPITPKQAAKALKKVAPGLEAELIADMWIVPYGETKVVISDENRAAKAFS